MEIERDTDPLFSTLILGGNHSARNRRRIWRLDRACARPNRRYLSRQRAGSCDRHGDKNRTLHRSGKVLSYALEAGAEFRLLDDEALAVVARSSPMPAFPDEIDQSEMELRLPVVFSLR